jgi:5'-nucleotidase
MLKISCFVGNSNNLYLYNEIERYKSMMNDRPLILITNDDGIQAKGIKELIFCLRAVGDIVVFAPDGPRSGMSSAITSVAPIHYTLVKKEEGLTQYCCSGTPVDCVKLAVNEVLDRKPDLLVSGINHGTNMAICVHYSGTMGAAIEGCIFNIPSIGVSLTDTHPDADFTESCRLARKLARTVLKEGLPKGTYLNLNVPNIPRVKGMKVCKQADGRWVKEFLRMKSPADKEVYWLTGEFQNHHPVQDDSDTVALEAGYASLVPCKIDVTDYAYLNRFKQWEIEEQ